MRFNVQLSFAIALLLIFTSCQKQPPPVKSSWHGSVALIDGQRLSFVMVLDLTAPAPSGYFLNGTEETPIPEIYFSGDSLRFVFSEYGAAMNAVWNDGRFDGEFLRFRADTVRNSFEASPVNDASAPPAPATKNELPLIGKFRTYLRNGDAIDSLSVATFWARGDSVFGTIMGPDGDYGLMAGTQTGDSAQLGRFTGWQGQLMKLARDQNRWTGTLYYRLPPSISFTLEPRPSAVVEIPEANRTSVIDKRKPFSFSGVSVVGDTVTNLDPKFKGKALIVDIMGTWCHNCMDAAPVLQKLYTDLGSQGLEVVSLSFEIRDDLQTARKNLLMFQERYGIAYTVLFCGSTQKENVDTRLRSQLKNFSAYPTTLFIDKRGIIQHIHEGFKGPGTGEEYQQQVDMYYDFARKLLGARTVSR